MKGKGIAILLILLLITGITACGRESVDSPGSSKPSGPSASAQTQQGASSAKKSLTTDELSMSLFEWDVREEVIADELGYRLNLRNKSSYPVLSTEILYKTRDSVTNEELKQFDNFKKAHKQYINPNEDNRNISLIGQSSAYIKPGQYLQNLPVTIGIRSMTWYDTPSYDQFILMRPASFSLGLVKDNTLYHCQYDFISRTWSIDPNAEALNVWPDNDLAGLIPKPSCDYYLLSTKENDNYLSITAYGISKKDFESYVRSVKEKGFTLKPDTGPHYYAAEDRKNNSTDIIYDKENWNMTIHVNL